MPNLWECRVTQQISFRNGVEPAVQSAHPATRWTETPFSRLDDGSVRDLRDPESKRTIGPLICDLNVKCEKAYVGHQRELR